MVPRALPEINGEHPVVTTLIRRYVESDIDSILEAVLESRHELSQWMSWCHQNYNRDDAESWVNSRAKAWNDREEWGFVIVDERDRFLGTCGIHRIDLRNGLGEMGYWVRSSMTRQGIATAAAKAIAQWAFTEMELHRIEILTSTANRASQVVAERAGAVHEGTLRERLRVHERWHDAELFALTSKQP
tara:strand:+ start:122127 stop:122690 length:564 start_codon:yes stop_codon:yes gene_type:complete